MSVSDQNATNEGMPHGTKTSIDPSVAQSLSASARAIQQAMEPALQMKRAIQEILKPWLIQQEAFNRRLREMILPSMGFQSYLAAIAAQNKKILDASFAQIRPETLIHRSWMKVFDSIKFNDHLKDYLSHIYKNNLQTEKLFLKFDYPRIFELSIFTTFQKRMLQDYLSSYACLSRSIKRWDEILALPRFALTDASRENLLSGLSLAYLKFPKIDLGGSDKDYIEAEVQSLQGDINLLRQSHPDLARMIKGARQALVETNIDRIRHVLVSLREGLTHLIHRYSPDRDVIKWVKDNSKSDELLHNGRPTRKARLLFICRKINYEPLEKFCEKDVQATLELINVFQRVHESIPCLTNAQLRAIIAKTESVITFILRLVQEI